MYPDNTKHTSHEHISLRGADSFKKFYTSSHLMVFRFIYGLYGGPTEDVEDLTAETYMRAWKSRHNFSGSEHAALGWVIKIARNLVIDTHRRQKLRGYTQDIEKHIVPANDPDPEQETQLREQIKTLWDLLQNISTQQREILILRYILGWRVQDIGHHLEMKENTVSVNIARAIKRIRQNWPP